MKLVTRVLVDAITWQGLRADSGSGADLPHALHDLWYAASEEEAQRCYWRIDNEAVVQGQLYEAAEPTLEVLLSMAPMVPEGPRRRAVAELIQQIVFGEPHNSEVERGNVAIASRCKELAAGALWLFYAWAVDVDSEVRELALLIIQKVEQNAERRSLIFAACRENDPSPHVRKIISRIDPRFK